MGLVATIARGLGAPTVQSVPKPADTPMTLDAWVGVASTQAGQKVTVTKALGLDAVWACVRVLTDGVSSLPLKTYEELGAGGRKPLGRGDYTYRLLHDEPNPEMTAPDMWSTLAGHLVSYGDGFLGKELNAFGQLIALWPISPDRVTIRRINGVKTYKLTDETGRRLPRLYTDADLIHVKGLSLDGLRGLSPIGMVREAVGAGLAMHEYLNRFYSNSAIPRGVLVSKEEIGEAGVRRLRSDWEKFYKGARNAHRIAVLEQDVKFERLTMSFADAQFVEQVNMTAAMACRIFRVPISMIAADAAKSSLTYRTVEGDNLQFLTHSLRPWLVRIEAALNRDPDVFPQNRDRRRSRFVEFNVDALLRADGFTRAQTLAIATGGRRWLKPSEARGIENLEPDDSLDDEEAPAQQPQQAATKQDVQRAVEDALARLGR